METKSYAGDGKVYSQEVNLTDVAWIDPTQGQYAQVNTKTASVDATQIKSAKGNIPINQDLLNKYSTVKEIFDKESNNFDGKVNVNTNISELNNIDVSNLNSKETKELAYKIFKKYNSKSEFFNAGKRNYQTFLIIHVPFFQYNFF